MTLETSVDGWSAEEMMGFIKEHSVPCPTCGKHDFTDIRQFNLMRALMAWVEDGCVPEEMRKVRVDRKTGETLEEGMEAPFRLEDE